MNFWSGIICFDCLGHIKKRRSTIPVFSFLIFCLETTVRENNWMGMTSVVVMQFFFWKCHSRSTWPQLCSKFFLNNYEAFETTFERHLKILLTWINISVQPATRHLTYCYMLPCLSDKSSFKFQPSIDRIAFATIYLRFFTRTSKIMMRLNVVSCEGLQPQNVVLNETFAPVNGQN